MPLQFFERKLNLNIIISSGNKFRTPHKEAIFFNNATTHCRENLIDAAMCHENQSLKSVL